MADNVTALVQRNVNGKPTFAKEQISKPRPEAHQLLVKISHVAQNPTDSMYGDH
jgi:NADPH:quinone reductase-like Zn-dependent oxidoreductase